MLRVLADHERHGYEIKKQVERILGGRSINNNVLYPALLADDNEFQTRVAFFADLDAGDRLRILRVRRQIIEDHLAHLAALRPDTEEFPWGLRVMDFTIERFRQELRWLDDLETAAGKGSR